jgi:hypothetical protein
MITRLITEKEGLFASLLIPFTIFCKCNFQFFQDCHLEIRNPIQVNSPGSLATRVIPEGKSNTKKTGPNDQKMSSGHFLMRGQMARWPFESCSFLLSFTFENLSGLLASLVTPRGNPGQAWKTHNFRCGFSFAEKEGFEPPEV